MADQGPAQGITAGTNGFLSKLNLATTSGGVGTEFGELDEVDLAVTNDMNDATSHQSGGWKTQKPGLKSWSGTAKGLHLGADVTQKAMRDALTGSTPLYLTIYPEGVAATKPQQVGTCFIKDWKFTGSAKDLAKAEFSIEGTGPLVESAQPAV